MVTLDSLHALLEHEVMVTMVFDCSVTVETGPVGVSVAGADDSGALDSGADDSGALDSGADDSGVVAGALDSGVVSGTVVSGALDSGTDDSEALDSGVVSGTEVTEVESTLEGTGVVSVNGQKVV